MVFSVRICLNNTNHFSEHRIHYGCLQIIRRCCRSRHDFETKLGSVYFIFLPIDTFVWGTCFRNDPGQEFSLKIYYNFITLNHKCFLISESWWSGEFLEKNDRSCAMKKQRILSDGSFRDIWYNTVPWNFCFGDMSHFIVAWFSMGDWGVQVSVRSSVRSFVFPSTFTLGVLWAQLLLQFCTDHFETLHVFSTWYEDVHVVWI